MRDLGFRETGRGGAVRVARPFVPRSLLPFLALALAGVLMLVAVRLQSTAGNPSAIGPAISLQARTADTHVAGSSAPADRFIQSVVSRDGDLGWHQLCGAVRSRLSSAELVRTAQAQRAHDAAAGVTLTWGYLGTRPLQQGGALRFYLLTAHWPGGATDHRTYIVRTDASGCVEDVQNG